MRCRVKYACGHHGIVYLDGTMQHVYHRMDLLEHMRCRDCVDAEGTKLVTMQYGEYRNHFAACRTKPDSYDPDFKTIAVYVPEDYETNGSTASDLRAEEVRAALQIIRRDGNLSAKAETALAAAEASILGYLRKMPIVSAYTAASNCRLALPANNWAGNDPLNTAYAAICSALK